MGDSADPGLKTAPTLATVAPVAPVAPVSPVAPVDSVAPVAVEAPRRRRRLATLLSEPMWVLGLVILIDETDKNIVRGMIGVLEREFHVGDSAIGLLVSLALFFNGVITVPAGYLADRWNRKRAISQTVVGWSALTALGAVSLGFPMLVGMRSLLGFGQGVTEPSAASLIGDYYPPAHRGRAFSIQQVMLLAGTGLGIGLGGLIGTTLGWRAALVIVAIPGLGIAALVARLREPKRGSADLIAAVGGGEIEHAGADDHPNLFEHGWRQFLRDMWDGLRADMRTIVSIRTMRYALVGVAALLFTITAIAVWLPQYYERHLFVAEGRGEGLVALLIAIGGIPGVLIGGRVADRYAPRFTGGRLALPAVFLFAGTLCFTGSYLIRPAELEAVAVASAFALQLVGIFIMTMAIPGLRAGLTDAIPAHLRGAGFGAFNLVAVVCGQAAAPLIVGIVSGWFDENLRVAFLLMSPFMFAGALVLFRARKFLDEDMQKIMMAVLTAMQEEKERREAEAEGSST